MMSPEELVRLMRAGMRVSRSSIHSPWYGVTDTERFVVSPTQIVQLVRKGVLVYTGDRQIGVKLK